MANKAYLKFLPATEDVSFRIKGYISNPESSNLLLLLCSCARLKFLVGGWGVVKFRQRLEERLADVEADLPQQLALHINGCPNSCARIQTADIGLKGQIITVNGEQVPGYQVHLGGKLANHTNKGEGGMGRTVRGLKVPASGLADYVERLARTYLAECADRGQSFAEWALVAEEEKLQ